MTTERIAELTAAWEEGANYGELPEHYVRASDYALSEDDYRAGLSDDEAAEIVALIEQQAENQKRAELIAEETLRGIEWPKSDGVPLAEWEVRALVRHAALAALTETENRA